jgi:hypothetical protein
VEPKTRRRRIALAAAALLTSPLLAVVASAPSPAQAGDPQLWPVVWDLNKNHDVEELSRVFDKNEDGWVDARVMPEGDLEDLLNASDFSIHVDACAAPAGFVSFDWTLARPDGGEVISTHSTAECFVDIALPERPFPETKEYDVTAIAHYPATHDQTVVSRVKVRDVFMVGLGDSYGSGEGNPLDAWHFGDPHAEWDNNRCHRSRLSGQEQAARMLDTIKGINVTFLHVACSGALASEGILHPYAGLIVDDGVAPLPPQIEQVAEFVAYSAVDPAARRYPDLVVTSIGGNDAGFADVVLECLYPSWIPIPIPVFPYFVPYDIDECNEDGAAKTEIFEKGVLKLPDLYREMNEAITGQHESLPALCHPTRGCEFMITEYPDGATDEDGETCEYLGFVEEEFQWVIDEMVPTLNGTLSNMAQELGWVYVDGIRANFDRHGICAEDDYFRDIAESFEIQKDKNGSFHPNTEGHYFGYAPEITESARYALGFPYPWSYTPFVGYVGRDVPQVCDTVVRDGNLESFVPAPPTDISSLDLPSEIADGLTNGSLPNGIAGASTCEAATGVKIPTGQGVMELRTGRPGCPDDPRPCRDSSSGSTLLRFPTFGDQQPAIVARAEADVARKANDESSFAHRSGAANAQGTTVFYATPFNGSSVVNGEIVVDLSTVTQAGGADSSALSEFDMWVRTVGPQPDCSGNECNPNTVREIGRVKMSLQRTTCEETSTFPNNCQSVYGQQRIHTDRTILEAYAGNTTIVDIDEYDVNTTGTAIGSWVSVGGGLRSPARMLRIPYSVPAGTAVTIQVSAGAYSTVLEDCTSPINPLPCSAQTRTGAMVTFDPDIDTGALIPLSGYTGLPVDKTAPVVTATPSGPAGTNGWYTGAANVALAATDTGEGVASISYKVDGGSTVVVNGATANVALPTNGTHLVQYTAKDVAGNESEPQSVTVKVDAAAPTVTVAPQSGLQYGVGTVVATNLQCGDLLSGLAGCTGPASLDTSTLGEKTATFTATDLAGNTKTVTVTYTVVTVAPPDRITLSIKELRFNVSGSVVSGGFTVTRAANGEPTAIHGTAVVLSPSGSETTISIDADKVRNEWTGTTTIDDPAMGVDVVTTIAGRNDVKADGATNVKGKATAKKPKYTVEWTLTDLG